MTAAQRPGQGPRQLPKASAADPEALAGLRAAVEAAWPSALARWSRFVMMGDPEITESLRSVAQIHLGTRLVSLDGPMIIERGLLDSVEAILAHEVGHHVRYPGTLAVSARLQMIEKSIIALEDYSLINIFTDLLINEHLGHELRDPLAAVYRAFHGDIVWERDPAFLFYLSIYEELWRLEPGALMGPGWTTFAARYPSYRADAQLLAQNIFHLGPNLYTQFLYFLSIVIRYIEPPDGEGLRGADPYDCLYGEPGPEDWADALLPDAREREAVRRAVAEGWLKEAEGNRITGPDALRRRIASLPGQGTQDASAVPEVMAAYYRQEAERYLLRPPNVATLGEAVVPTTLEDWEPGDPVQEIDWLATLTSRGGQLGAVAPMRRTRIAEVEGYDVPFWQPRIEIYLDVSGSMPDPRWSHNAMTLAAQILTLGAVRAGGQVRALLYSTANVAYWRWCQSEVEISRFLMHYIGGGTEYPFDVLQESVDECRRRQPTRAIITDSDFHHNHEASADAARIFKEACRASTLVLLLHNVHADLAARYRQIGAQVVVVQDMEDFPRMAVALARALFAHQEGQHGAL